MELRDVSQGPVPLPPAMPEAAAPWPEPQRVLRQPSRRAAIWALVLSAFWIGSATAFLAGFLGFAAIAALPWHWLAGLIFAIVFPVILVFMAAALAARSEALQLAVEDIAAIAQRLTVPEEAAGREISRLGRAVRREIDALNNGLEAALGRVRSIETSIAERLRGADEAARALQDSGELIRAKLSDERQRLADLTSALDQEAHRLGETVKLRSQGMAEIAETAARMVENVQGRLDERLAMAARSLETAVAAAQAAIASAAREGANLTAAADTVEARLTGAVQRQDKQRLALVETAAAIKEELAALESGLGRHTDSISALAAVLGEQTRKTDSAAADAVQRAESAGLALAARSQALTQSIAADAQKLLMLSGETEEALKVQARTAAEAAEQLRASFDLLQERGGRAALAAKGAAEDLANQTQNTVELVAQRAAAVRSALMTDAASALDQIAAKAAEKRGEALTVLSNAHERLTADARDIHARLRGEFSAISEAALAKSASAQENVVAAAAASIDTIAGKAAQALSSFEEALTAIDRRAEAARSRLAGIADGTAATIEAQTAAAQAAIAQSLSALTEKAELLKTIAAEEARRAAEAESRRVAEALERAAEEARRAEEEQARLEAEAKARAEAAEENARAGAEALAKAEPQPQDEPPAPETESGSAKSQWFGFTRRLAQRKTPKERAEPAPGDWRLSAALAAAESRPRAPVTPGTSRGPVDLHREALHVIEKLQALAIDLDRAFGDDPPPDLWRRYIAGERSVFTRRLTGLIGRDGSDRIAGRYASDPDFRTHADLYMAEFEGLLDEAQARDRDQVLVETFLTSQVGRLYLLLAGAVGRV
jgi:hypothetical protein